MAIRGACYARLIVSILVVLDWTMMLFLLASAELATNCFNPCCIGLDNDAALCDKKDKNQ